MRTPLAAPVAILLLLTRAQFLPSAAPHPSRSVPVPPPSTLSLETFSFEFPGAGERNNNRTIGDFCCTGHTATVRTRQGAPVGYIYFHDFDGGINVGDRSTATKFGILVSGLSDASRSNSPRVKSAVEFEAKELEPGLTRETKAGALVFTVTILEVEFFNEAHSRYWMDRIKVRVDVREVSGI